MILIQDAQHREAMGSLHTAERSSLISEIHQLRGQLEKIHQGEPVQKNSFTLTLTLLVMMCHGFIIFTCSEWANVLILMI